MGGPPTVVLADRYLLTAKLGAGGMGVVYRGVDQRLDRPVAVKVLNRLTADDDAVKRFEQEAKAAASVRHRNVVEIYDYGETDDAFFIAMELLNGEDLAHRLKRSPLEWPEIASITRQMCAGATAAHEAGLVHRDLKPANIFLSPSSEDIVDVRVLDFGVCTTVGVRGGIMKTETGIVVGTPAYLAPETYEEETQPNVQRDQRRDTYALGVMLFEMVTGRRPFKKTHSLQLALQVQNTDPPAPTEVGSHLTVPSEVDALILEAISRDPMLRPDRARSISERLDAALVQHGLLGDSSGNLGDTAVFSLSPSSSDLPIEVTGSLVQEVAAAGAPPPPPPEASVDPFAAAQSVPTPSAGQMVVVREKPRRWPWLALLAGLLAVSAFVMGQRHADRTLPEETSAPPPGRLVALPTEPKVDPAASEAPDEDVPSMADPASRGSGSTPVALAKVDPQKDSATQKASRIEPKSKRSTPPSVVARADVPGPATTPSKRGSSKREVSSSQAPLVEAPPKPPEPPTPVKVIFKAGGESIAWVRVGDREDGGGTPVRFELLPGEHEVEWEYASGKRDRKKITVSGQSERMKFVLGSGGK